jgi:hypothetical protein
MVEITLITLLGQVLLPIALLAWVWRGSCRSRAEWLLKTLILVAYLALMVSVGIALLIPWYAAYGTAALALPASICAWRRMARKRLNPVGATGRFSTATTLVLAATCLVCLAWAAAGFVPPPLPTVSVALPLVSGTYLTLNGGYSILINPHMKALTRDALQPYRAQSYAVDIVKLNRFGLRARGLWPRELGSYEIFGAPVLSPCEGRVLRVEDRLPDQVPPRFDRANPAGNFVYLECSEAGVLLAHLMQASIRVAPGEHVRSGQLLARVGNSGYSTEPHLHLHAQQKTTGAEFLSADPWLLTIDGRHLFRSSRIRAD